MTHSRLSNRLLILTLTKFLPSVSWLENSLELLKHFISLFVRNRKQLRNIAVFSWRWNMFRICHNTEYSPWYLFLNPSTCLHLRNKISTASKLVCNLLFHYLWIPDSSHSPNFGTVRSPAVPGLCYWWYWNRTKFQSASTYTLSLRALE